MYIAEAHASDEWPVGAKTSVTTQPKTLTHRLQLANHVHTHLLGQGQSQQEGKLEVLCDDMSDNFERSMAAWPIRMYVLDPRTAELRYKAQPDLSPDVYGYSLDKMQEWLERNIL